jgi:hypothetical protein
MKTKTFLSIKILTLFSFIFLLNSCTNLDEVLLDEQPSNGVSNPAGSLAAAYDRLGDGTFTDHGAVFAMQ